MHEFWKRNSLPWRFYQYVYACGCVDVCMRVFECMNNYLLNIFIKYFKLSQWIEFENDVFFFFLIFCFSYDIWKDHNWNSDEYSEINFTTVKNVQSVKKKINKIKQLNLIQYKLSYRNNTGTNHHGLLSTSVRSFKTFLRSSSTWRVST